MQWVHALSKALSSKVSMEFNAALNLVTQMTVLWCWLVTIWCHVTTVQKSLIVTYRYTTAPWSLAFLIFSKILPRAGTTSPLWSGPLQPKCARIEMLIEKENAAATSTRVYLKLGCTPQISRFMGHFQTYSVACNLQLAAQSPRRTAACLQSSMLWVHWGFLTTNEF